MLNMGIFVSLNKLTKNVSNSIIPKLQVSQNVIKENLENSLLQYKQYKVRFKLVH